MHLWCSVHAHVRMYVAVHLLRGIQATAAVQYIHDVYFEMCGCAVARKMFELKFRILSVSTYAYVCTHSYNMHTQTGCIFCITGTYIYMYTYVCACEYTTN